MLIYRITLLIILFFSAQSFAATKTIHLSVDYKNVDFGGKNRKAFAINNQIPAPILHFKEGDTVKIYVHNHLDKETAIHWHGIIVPWQMDGVEGISQKAILPGKTFLYQFTLKQSGTYWYHAHSGLQEQEGMYGALVIDPLKPSPYQFNKDFPIVLSDWSDTRAENILANLKKEGDYYAPRFPLQPSLQKFLHDYQRASKANKKSLLNDYLSMQQSRMSLYDLSDVAYDAFLLNGQANISPWTAKVRVGDSVRLRFIGAAGSSIFNVKIPGAKLNVIHVDGNDVQSHEVNSIAVAPGETYDVLVKIQKRKPYIIYAESRDTLGAAFGALITDPKQEIHFENVKPFPEPENVNREMMTMMMENKIQGMLPKSSSDHTMMHAGMNHAQMKHSMGMDMKMEMPTEPSILSDNFAAGTSHYETSRGTKYQSLHAKVPTNNPEIPVSQVINMELFGYMDRFIWFINGTPEYNAKPISLKPGKRYRFVFTNNSMMHHPMHIHGHWFILRKGLDEYDPLLHTIDVAPGATITADVDTDASGQWFFHCHMLYHMTTGMSRVFQYSTLLAITKGEAKPQLISHKTAYHNRPIVRIDELRTIDTSLVKHPMAHPMGSWSANFLDIGIDPFNDAERLNYKGLFGRDYHKLELFVNDAEVNKGHLENADIDIFYWHLINQFWAVKAGVNYIENPDARSYWQPSMGLEGLMPYFIEVNSRLYYYHDAIKWDLELSRDTQLTNNFFIKTGIRTIAATKTVANASLGNGLNQIRVIVRPYYRLAPGLSIFVEYENESDYGTFKSLEKNQGNAIDIDTVTLGLAVVF